MATITEDLVQSSVVSSTGVTDFGNTVASDDSRASFDCSSGTNIIFELTNLSQTPTSILEAQIRHESQAQAAATAVIQMEMLNGSNTQINTQFSSFSQTTDQLVNLTTHTTNGLTSAAFTENDINTLRVKLTYITEAGAVGTALIDHIYVRVKYNVADPSGGLIKLNSGKVKLNSGLVKIIA
jgi:hypothetical protein